MVTKELSLKLDALCCFLEKQESMGVAFSGGIDSTLLAKVAHDVLGNAMMAVTVRSHVVPRREVEEAVLWCKANRIAHDVIDFDEFLVPGFQGNPRDRCYLCKRALFETMLAWCSERGLSALGEGTNVDDEGDYRPGMRALAELGVLSPLREAGLAKSDVRELARSLGIPTWNKPSSACLASRIAYGDRITEGKLEMIERAEEALHDMGFSQLRVRMHGREGELARIEVPNSEIARLMQDETRDTVTQELRKIGFAYVTVDTSGFRSGSMNEVL